MTWSHPTLRRRISKPSSPPSAIRTSSSSRNSVGSFRRFAVQTVRGAVALGTCDNRSGPAVQAINTIGVHAGAGCDQFPSIQDEQRHTENDGAEDDPNGTLHGREYAPMARRFKPLSREIKRGVAGFGDPVEFVIDADQCGTCCGNDANRFEIA